MGFRLLSVHKHYLAQKQDSVLGFYTQLCVHTVSRRPLLTRVHTLTPGSHRLPFRKRQARPLPSNREGRTLASLGYAVGSTSAAVALSWFSAVVNTSSPGKTDVVTAVASSSRYTQCREGPFFGWLDVSAIITHFPLAAAERPVSGAG